MYRILRLKKESKAWDLPYYFAPQKPKSIDWFSAFRLTGVHSRRLDTVMLPKCIASVSIRFGIEAEDITNFGRIYTYYNLGFFYCIPRMIVW